MGLSRLAGILAVPAMLVAGCATRSATMEWQRYYNCMGAPVSEVYDRFGKDSFEAQISRLWESGFLESNEKLRNAVFDNYYTIVKFGDSSGIVGTYTAHYDQDFINPMNVIRIGQRIFCSPPRYSVNLNIPSLEDTLAHEIFHDIWHYYPEIKSIGILSADKLQDEFRERAEQLYAAAVNAKSKEEKERLMFASGIASELGVFEEFLEHLVYKMRYYNHYYHSSYVAFGDEMFAYLAGRVYANKGKLRIPISLQKYYEGIITRDALVGSVKD